MAKQRVNFATYPQDYYTGAQARIYFGSIWVDDIATIQYQTSHSKAPLYGYGDHQFRTVAKGQFLVRGSFTIAFKETGYLYSVLQLVKSDSSGLKVIGKSKEAFDTYINYIGAGMTVEQALDYAASTGTTNKVTNTNFNSAGDFEDISEVMEDAIWGKPGTPANFSARIPRSDELDYNKYTGGNGSANDIDRNGFDILLTFGNYRTGTDTPDHTMISINDVHITGESVIVSPSAEPIGLTCEFFARGLNERISSSWDAATYKGIKDTNQKVADNIAAKDKAAKLASVTAAVQDEVYNIWEVLSAFRDARRAELTSFGYPDLVAPISNMIEILQPFADHMKTPGSPSVALEFVSIVADVQKIIVRMSELGPIIRKTGKAGSYGLADALESYSSDLYTSKLSIAEKMKALN